MAASSCSREDTLHELRQSACAVFRGPELADIRIARKHRLLPTMRQAARTHSSPEKSTNRCCVRATVATARQHSAHGVLEAHRLVQQAEGVFQGDLHGAHIAVQQGVVCEAREDKLAIACEGFLQPIADDFQGDDVLPRRRPRRTVRLRLRGAFGPPARRQMGPAARAATRRQLLLLRAAGAHGLRLVAGPTLQGLEGPPPVAIQGDEVRDGCRVGSAGVPDGGIRMRQSRVRPSEPRSGRRRANGRRQYAEGRAARQRPSTQRLLVQLLGPLHEVRQGQRPLEGLAACSLRMEGLGLTPLAVARREVLVGEAPQIRRHVGQCLGEAHRQLRDACGLPGRQAPTAAAAHLHGLVHLRGRHLEGPLAGQRRPQGVPDREPKHSAERPIP
mmetsp:Transcript_22459/g.64557  ORF Transcript_22459/g.64557 Transcript_22459/m.64557 type:complete len:388 (-) Transcript_22459:811-1974(-)